MKNITVTVDDETYRGARIWAAEQGTSVSKLVRKFLTDLGSGESEFQRLKRREVVLRNQIKAFAAGDKLSRDEVHERRR